MREMQGHLSLLGLGTLLQTAAQQGTQGKLIVTRDGVTKMLAIDGDYVRLVMASQRRAAMLGQILIREGKITLQALQEILKKMAKGGPRLGQLLIASGAISAEDLQQALEQQALEELFDLFTWEEAHFEFREERVPPQDQMPPVAVMGLVLEAARRGDHYRKIRRVIPSMQLVPKRLKPLPEDDPGLSPLIVRSLGVYIDDQRPVADVLKLCPFPGFDVESTLAGLVEAGAVKLHDPRAGHTFMARVDEESAPSPTGFVLVLSDLHTFGETLAGTLTRAGLAASAHDPDAESLAFGISRPDGVVLDLLDSTKGIERLARLTKELGAPIVVLAQNPSPEAILQLNKAGAREVFIKPVSIEALVPKLRRLFNLEAAKV